jgi:hypothetical protein
VPRISKARTIKITKVFIKEIISDAVLDLDVMEV